MAGKPKNIPPLISRREHQLNLYNNLKRFRSSDSLFIYLLSVTMEGEHQGIQFHQVLVAHDMIEDKLEGDLGEHTALGLTSTQTQTTSLMGLMTTWRRNETQTRPLSCHLPARRSRATLPHQGIP